MKRIFSALLSAFLLGLTACLGALELALAWSWLKGTAYVMRFGRLENPYDAENAEIAGFCALALLPLFLAALAWTAYWLIERKKRAEAQTER